MLTSFGKAFRIIGRGRPFRLVALIAGAVASSLVEMVGALLIVVLLGVVTSPGASNIDIPMVGDVRAHFSSLDDDTFLLALVGTLGVFFLFRIAVQVGFTYILHRVAQSSGAHLASRLAGGYLRLPYSFHLRRSTAELVRNAQQSVSDLTTQCFLPAIQVMAESIVVLGLFALMLLVEPMATLLAVGMVGTAALLLLRIVQPRLKRIGRRAQQMHMSTLSILQQSLHGVRDIKVLGAEEHFGTRYRVSRHNLGRALYLRGTVAELPRHVIETTLFGLILLLLGWSVATDQGTEQLLPALGLFAYAGLRLMPSLQKIVGGLNNIRFASTALDQVVSDLDIVEKVGRTGRQSPQRLTFERELRLMDVSFAYEATDRPAIDEANLTIRPGQLVGICGPTGGGKTTLTDLLTGILPPTKGQVTVDGIDIKTAQSEWFSKLGVVPQMVFLTDDTLRRNIALGTSDGDIDELRMAEAVRLAQLTDFIDSLPDGLETTVGERGVRVSGGQRQRVAIARALYRNPEILVFDEGTSALDNATEAELMGSLERLRGGHTILLVAHRLSTVRNCDIIVYLEAGRIVGVGGFDELISMSPGFRSLAERG